MFTGIVEAVGTVKALRKGAHSAIITVEAPQILDDVHLGDSIAVNGVCLTVTAFTAHTFDADIMHETLDRSDLGTLHAGSKVNSVLTGAEIAGLDLSDLSNEVTVSNEYLWTVKAGSTEGTVALYNEAAGKYLNFAEGARPVTLGDEPTEFALAQTDHHVAGIAAAFHLNNYYLNYSDSQNGFCAYDASTYS